jgi:hypothetical protein
MPEELVRLNRRGSGTGLLGSRIAPAGLLLVTAGAALLSLNSHPRTPANGLTMDRPATTQSALAAKSKLNYGHLPLMFEPNQGQTDPKVRFIARGGGYGLFLTEQEAVLSLQGPMVGTPEARPTSVVRMTLAGANEHPAVNGTEKLPGKSNYFIGNDPARWRQNVPQYARVEYAQVYPGVDLVYYGSQGHLEYDFQVAPGTDPKTIQLSFKGSRALKLDAGDLVLQTAAGDVRLEAPRVYQQDGDTRKPVAGHFALLSENRVGFDIGAYDRSKTLVIDPVLSYSTYLGGSGSELHPTIAVDSALDMYVTGATSSTDFPVTDGSTFKAGATTNVFVAKYDPPGANLLFASYIGGTGADSPVGIAVDAATNIYVAGTTTSTNFPTSTSAFQTMPTSPGNPHAFVTQLISTTNASTYSLGYSTYLSGGKTDTATGMTLDNKGFVYVIGITDSTDFPLAPVAGTFQSTLQGANALFISKVAPTSTGANSLNFSTYFGGGFPTTGTVTGGAIAVDNNANVSNIYFTGATNYIYTGQNSQTDFPIRNAYQPCLGLAPSGTQPQTCDTTITLTDAFIAKLNPGTTTGAQLLYCTYLGGSGTDVGLGIGLDASGNAYITGSTNSPTFPVASSTIKGPEQNPGGGTDAFVAKINNPATGTGSNGSTNVQFTYFSYLGGSANDVGNAIAVDNVQGAEVVGTTASANFPVTPNALQSTLKGTQDAFVARLDTLGTTTGASQYVSFLGGGATETGTGVALDSDSNVYLTGETTSTDFPTKNPKQAAKSGGAGIPDAFVTKLGPSLAFTVEGHPPGSNSVNAGNQIAFNYTITNNGDTTANVAFIDNLSGGNGSAPVTFVSASVSGGSCASTPTDNKVLCSLGTIKGGGTSTVTINLTPTGGGTVGNSGTLTVGAFSQTAVAQAVVVNTFKLEALKANNTVVAGNPASYPIKLTPLTNFTASISITCSAGLPTPSTCTPSTNPVTLQGASPSTVTLVISTTPRVTTTASTSPRTGLFYASWLPITGIAFLGMGVGSRLRRGRRVLGGLLFVVVGTLILLQPACGGHSSSSTTTGTPAGTYTVNVTASSGSFSQTTPITLVVQ